MADPGTPRHCRWIPESLTPQERGMAESLAGLRRGCGAPLGPRGTPVAIQGRLGALWPLEWSVAAIGEERSVLVGISKHGAPGSPHEACLMPLNVWVPQGGHGWGRLAYSVLDPGPIPIERTQQSDVARTGSATYGPSLRERAPSAQGLQIVGCTSIGFRMPVRLPPKVGAEGG